MTKNGRDSGIKRKMIKIDNYVFVIGLYNQNSFILVANFITISLPTACTVDVRA